MHGVDLVNIGDTIQTKTFMGVNNFVITRVTKTLAMSKRESDGYEHTFKRLISWNMSHPSQRYNTTEYNVINNKD